MRRSTIALAAVLTAGLAGPALGDKKADASLSGTYEVQYNEVANNCTTTGMSLSRGTLKISAKGKQLQVDIQLFSVMVGSQTKGGKLRAASKIGASPIDGTKAKASVAGRVEDGLIQLVFVVEFYVDKKPLCTQSWNVSGVKQEASATAALEDAGSSLTTSTFPALRP
jgi:hypothetical protein